MASVSEIVRFLHSYQKMTPHEKEAQQIVLEVGRFKKVIEESLSSNLILALGQGIQLGEACQDPAWVKKLTENAIQFAVNMEKEDQEDLQPIFQKILGHRI